MAAKVPDSDQPLFDNEQRKRLKSPRILRQIWNNFITFTFVK